MAHLDERAAACGYTGYMDKHVTYPPRGQLPLLGTGGVADDGCQLWMEIAEAAMVVNPAFNVYRIFDVVRLPSSPGAPPRADSVLQYPILWDVLGFPYVGRPPVLSARPRID